MIQVRLLCTKHDWLLLTPVQRKCTHRSSAQSRPGAIDVTECQLSYLQKMTVRTFNYATSTKVVLKFAKRWWEDTAIMNNRTIQDGSSSTDLPSIRSCVYPSYGLNGSADAPGVLLASYSWSKGAQHLGAGDLERPMRRITDSMFTSRKTPAADGKLHFAGEATSVYHT